MQKVILICLLLLIVLARDDPKYDRIFGNKHATPRTFKQQQYWFDQIADHSNYHHEQYWKQRYWVIEDAFKRKAGPVFLYICGEYTCSGIPQYRQWSAIMAQQLHAIIIILQHRFYGESLPFGRDSFKLENMKLLSSEQALRDIANFIQYVKDNKLYGISNEPWVIAGGSYAGGLVAWFRYKYPHLVIASIASSAVINAIQNFEEFDEQIYQSSNRSGECSQTLRDVSQRVEDILYSSQEQAAAFKSQFIGGEFLSNLQFLFFFADSIVLPIQYGGRVALCGDLSNTTADQQLAYLVQNAKQIQVYEYSSYFLRNESFTYETQSFARPWYFQYCTEYGWFQTSSSRNPIRSKRLTLAAFREFCAAAFGDGAWAKVDRKNAQYGAINQAASKIFFANGVQDPWRWASLQQNRQKQMIARVIECDDMAHCVDMTTPTDSDCQELKAVRSEQLSSLKKWIAQYWRQVFNRKLNKIMEKKSSPW